MNNNVDKIDETIPKEPLPVFKTTTAAALEKMEFPPLKWAVETLLCYGLVLLVGAPKIGKSWLVLTIALAVASGRQLFGFEVAQCEVVYFALEDSARRLQSRLRMLGITGWPDGMGIVTDLPCESHQFLPCLEQHLDDNPNVKLIIIDTMQHVKGSSGYGNAYELDTAALKPFHRLAKDRDICLVMVHHTRKSESADPFEKISGSQGLMAVADTAIMVEAIRGEADRALRVTGRDVEERNYAMEFNGGTWQYLGDAAEVTMSDERRKILDYVRSAGHAVGPKEVSDATGLAYGSVKNAMPAMLAAGFLSKEAKGKYIPSEAIDMSSIAPTPLECDDLMTLEED